MQISPAGAEPSPQSSPAIANRRRLAAAMLLPLLVLVVAGLGWWVNRASPLKQARQLLAVGNTQAAAPLLRQYLELHPTDGEALLQLAGIESESDPRQAVELLQRIPMSDPHYAEALRQTALLGLTRELPEAAEMSLKSLVALNPDDFAARLALAELYFNSDLPKDALVHIEECLRLQPDRAQTLLLYAETLDDLGRQTEMVEPLERAIQLDPENFEIRANLAYALNQAGRIDEARMQAEKCLSRQPNAVDVRKILATILRNQGELDDALLHTRQVLAVLPGDLEMRLLEADVLLFQRQAEEAWQRLEPLYKQHAADRGLLSFLARAAQLTGRKEEARRFQGELLQAMQDNSQP